MYFMQVEVIKILTITICKRNAKRTEISFSWVYIKPLSGGGLQETFIKETAGLLMRLVSEVKTTRAKKHNQSQKITIAN